MTVNKVGGILSNSVLTLYQLGGKESPGHENMHYYRSVGDNTRVVVLPKLKLHQFFDCFLPLSSGYHYLPALILRHEVKARMKKGLLTRQEFVTKIIESKKSLLVPFLLF